MSGGFWRAVLPGPWPGLVDDLGIDGAMMCSSLPHAEALLWIETKGRATIPFWCLP